MEATVRLKAEIAQLPNLTWRVIRSGVRLTDKPEEYWPIISGPGTKFVTTHDTKKEATLAATRWLERLEL